MFKIKDGIGFIFVDALGSGYPLSYARSMFCVPKVFNQLIIHTD